MSSEVPGFGATARLFPTETWLELALRNGGKVTISTFLKNLSPEYRFRLMRNPLAEQGNIVVPRSRYLNEAFQGQQEKIENVRKKKLDPKAPAFNPSRKK